MTDVRALSGGGFAIRRAGVDVSIIARRFDVELPRRIEEFEGIHGARIPIAGIAEGNLSIADQHRNIVGPCVHGAGDFCGFGGYLRNRNGVCSVSAKIDQSRVEDVLNVGAELIFTLCAGRDRKQEKQRTEEVSVGAFHMNVGAKSRAGQE